MSTLGERLEGPRVRLEADGPDEYRVFRILDGLAIGRMALEEQHPALTPGPPPAAAGEESRPPGAGSALFVREMCIDRAHRGFGAGSAAATLVREAAEAAGRWRWLRAWAPADAGLAVYYWMRMGLRPVPGGGPDGGLLFEREIS